MYEGTSICSARANQSAQGHVPRATQVWHRDFVSEGWCTYPACSLACPVNGPQAGKRPGLSACVLWDRRQCHAWPASEAPSPSCASNRARCGRTELTGAKGAGTVRPSWLSWPPARPTAEEWPQDAVCTRTRNKTETVASAGIAQLMSSESRSSSPSGWSLFRCGSCWGALASKCRCWSTAWPTRSAPWRTRCGRRVDAEGRSRAGAARRTTPRQTWASADLTTTWQSGWLPGVRRRRSRPSRSAPACSSVRRRRHWPNHCCLRLLPLQQMGAKRRENTHRMSLYTCNRLCQMFQRFSTPLTDFNGTYADMKAECSEIGSLTLLDAPEVHASSDVREPISLYQAVSWQCKKLPPPPPPPPPEMGILWCAKATALVCARCGTVCVCVCVCVCVWERERESKREVTSHGSAEIGDENHEIQNVRCQFGTFRSIVGRKIGDEIQIFHSILPSLARIIARFTNLQRV